MEQPGEELKCRVKVTSYCIYISFQALQIVSHFAISSCLHSFFSLNTAGLWHFEFYYSITDFSSLVNSYKVWTFTFLNSQCLLEKWYVLHFLIFGLTVTSQLTNNCPYQCRTHNNQHLAPLWSWRRFLETYYILSFVI